jgi:GNAT superfamily N-acetyltransferase
MSLYLAFSDNEETLTLAKEILEHRLHLDSNSLPEGYYSVMRRLCNIHLERNRDSYCDNCAVYACGIVTDENNGQTVAAAIVSFSNNMEWVIHVFVRPEFRNSGIANQIIDQFHTHGFIDKDTLFKGSKVKLNLEQPNRKETKC